jgi:hypothetical protein
MEHIHNVSGITIATFFWGGTMKRYISAGILSLLLGAIGLCAQDGAKDDIKQAGRDTKAAAKSTGRATKKTAKETGRAVKHGTHATAKKARQGAEKIEDKTQ